MEHKEYYGIKFIENSYDSDDKHIKMDVIVDGEVVKTIYGAADAYNDCVYRNGYSAWDGNKYVPMKRIRYYCEHSKKEIVFTDSSYKACISSIKCHEAGILFGQQRYWILDEEFDIVKRISKKPFDVNK